jgi:hypothetical protein
MRFFRVEDTGDDCVCAGLIVDADAVSDAFDHGAIADEVVALMDGWHNPDMRRVINKAIAWKARTPPDHADPLPAQVAACIAETVKAIEARLRAKGPMYSPDAEWTRLQDCAQALRAAGMELERAP